MSKRITPLFASLSFRDFRLLWSAQILSELGDWAARVALAVLVYERTQSRVLTAAVVAVGMLPWLGLGQALATLSDRYPRRAVMVAADVVRSGMYAGMIVVDSPWGLLTLAFVGAAATPPFEAARAAVIPDVVTEERYGDALTLSNITYQSILVLGYMMGGGLVAALGARMALGVNAVTFLASAAMIVAIREGRVASTTRTIGSSLRTAMSTLLADPFLRRAAILTTVGSASAIVGEALVAVHVKEVLHSGSGSIGVLAAMVPVGTIIASAIAPRHGPLRMRLRASAAITVVGATAAAVGFSLEPNFAASAATYAALGVVFAALIPAYSFVGIRLPKEVRGSAFGLLQGTLLGGQALGSILGGLLANVVGVPEASALALLPAIGYGMYALVVVPAEPVSEPAT